MGWTLERRKAHSEKMKVKWAKKRSETEKVEDARHAFIDIGQDAKEEKQG